MFVIREVLSCKPGRVGDLTKRFKVVSSAIERMGHKPLRLLTDLSGEPFWTLIVESETESVEAFLDIEASIMEDDEVRKAMTGYHDLLRSGRREIYRLVD
jgi:hypothetical protein